MLTNDYESKIQYGNHIDSETPHIFDKREPFDSFLFVKSHAVNDAKDFIPASIIHI